MLFAVSIKKQVITPSKLQNYCPQISVNQPAAIEKSAFSSTTSEANLSGTLTDRKISSQLIIFPQQCINGQISYWSFYQQQFRIKFDPYSIKYVTSLPWAPNPASTSSKTNLPSPEPGTIILSPFLRYYLTFCVIILQVQDSGLSEHHSRQNCLTVVRIFGILWQAVASKGINSYVDDGDYQRLINQIMALRNFWLEAIAVCNFYLFLCLISSQQ